jgi:putative membrane protein
MTGGSINAMKRPILVLCIDRDNDLFEKAKVSGPLIGREKNLEGALALSLADPEDPDSNAIYYSIKTYDQMRGAGETVEIATLTGDKNLGFSADKEISAQLDRLIREINPTSCVLISDGASDEEMLPVIKSRLKVDSTKIVFIKQAKELEKTYFVLIEKLRDPYFAKIVLGIPGVLILLLSLSMYFQLGWAPVGIIVGLYLITRTLGISDFIQGMIKDIRFSFERTSWIGYIGAMAVLGIGAFVGYQSIQKGATLSLSPEKHVAFVIGNTVWILLISFLLVMIGESIDAIMDKKKFRITRYILYSAAAILSGFITLIGCIWIVNISPPYVDFGAFLFSIGLTMVTGYVAISFVNWYRKEVLLEMKIEGKEAISEHGTYIGKIVAIDANKGKIIVQNIFDKRYTIPISAVSSVDENVVLKSEE